MDVGITEEDGNGNQIIEPAEIIKVTATIENTGELPARNFKVEIRMDDSNIRPIGIDMYPWEKRINNLEPGGSIFYRVFICL